MTERPTEIPPVKGRPFGEIARLVRGIATLPALAPRWRSLPRGTGQPVMVLPGYMTSDLSTQLLRAGLSRLGYTVRGWGLGLNTGDISKLGPQVVDNAWRFAGETGQPLRLVGWSLGGTLARVVARQAPETVHSVLTMGTPVVGGPKYTVTAKAYVKRGLDLEKMAAQVARRNAVPIEAPITVLYSKRDGVVSWPACFDPNPENTVRHIEVKAGHLEMGFSAEVFGQIVVFLRRGRG